MRLFEVLTLLSLLPFVVAPLFKKRPFFINYFPFLAAIFALLSVVFEGLRWQMFPAYLLVIVCVLVAVWNMWQRKGNGRSTIGIIGSIAGILGLLIAFALPIALPVPKFTATTGPYAIGTETIYLVDESRAEIYTAEDGDPRELMAQIWYPAELTGDAEEALYLESLDVAGPVLAKEFGLPAFLFDHVNLAQTDIYQNVPAAEGDETFPVILFSHGLTGIRGQNTNMVRELVSNGYVVAAVDHTYAGSIAVFPDGRIIFYEPERIFTNGEANPVEGAQLVQVWADDLAFLLDELTAWNEEAGHVLNGRLDLVHIGIFGHSTGGGATLQFCLEDPRCTAGAPLDSWVLPVDESILQVPPSQPFMFINSPEWLGPINQQRGRAILAAMPNDGYELILANTGHYDFSDLALLSPLTPQLGLSGTINSHFSQTIQNEYLLAFFNHYLKNIDEPLLERPSPYPELTIEQP